MDFRRVAIITGKRAAGWSKAITCDLQQALEMHGILAQLVDHETLAEFCTTGVGSNPQTIFIDFNHRIVFPWSRPMVALMDDHPCSLIAELSAPRSEIAITGWVDATHLEALKVLGFKHRSFFLPHAGPQPVADVTPFHEREIDVFFAGTLEEPADRIRWGESHPDVPKPVTDSVFDAVELIEATGAAALAALLTAMSHHNVIPSQFSREVFGQLIALVLRIGEANRRVGVLAGLPDNLRIGVAADYFPKALRDRPHIRYLDYIDDFDQIRALMGNARIVLNTTLKFPAGSHERIWYAMAAGALVLTDSSVFMKQDFEDGRNILYLPQKCLGGQDLAMVADTAKDDAKLTRMADSAVAAYRERHTWTKRAPLLIDALRVA